MAALDLGALPTGTLVSSETSGFFPLGGGSPDRAFFVLRTLPNTYYAPGTVEGTGREWEPKHLRSLLSRDFRSQCRDTVDVRMRAQVDEEKHV